MGKTIAGLFGGKPKQAPVVAPPAAAAIAPRAPDQSVKGTASGSTSTSAGGVRLGGGLEKRKLTVPGLAL